MNEKEKYFIDLSKCSEEQQKHIFSLLPKHENKQDEELYEISDEYYILTYHYFKDWEWIVGVESYKYGKTELTYPDFIKLFEGGEGENKGWISSEIKPDKFQDVILYREDAGVFTGYYGNLAESLSEMAVEQHYNEGVSEETMWKEQFFYFGIEGNGILELDTEPTRWMPLPEPPKF